MIGYLWKQYGFELLFILAVVVIVILFIINLFLNKKGTYVDHSNMMWNLWNKNYSTPQHTVIDKKPFESKGETECRRVIEKLTGKPFPKHRPDFLKNNVTGGHNLELDCYNPDLKIAVEYNGEQHYKYIPYFHRNRDAFYNIKYRDEMKNRLCKENGVKLITVPYTIPINSIEQYLIHSL
jgi:hypothetical protein